MTKDPRDKGHETPRIASAVVAVAISLAFGAITASSSPLYAEVYPPVGSNRFTAEEFARNAERAITSATVETRTEPKRVRQHERSDLFASLIIGGDRPASAAPQVKVSLENEAALRPREPGAVEVFPEEGVVKGLDACRALPDGGCELTWRWTIIPRRSGTQTLLLTVSPLVYVDGQISEKFKKRNADIPVEVEVHPMVAAIEVAQQATDELDIDIPSGLTAGHSSTVSATLEESWKHDDGLVSSISLAAGPNSPATTIRRAGTERSSDRLKQTWAVEPAEAGVLELVFTALVKGQAGDRDLKAASTRAETVEVSPTIWERIDTRVRWLGGIVALAAGVFGLWTGWRRLRPGAGSE